MLAVHGVGPKWKPPAAGVFRRHGQANGRLRKGTRKGAVGQDAPPNVRTIELTKTKGVTIGFRAQDAKTTSAFPSVFQIAEGSTFHILNTPSYPLQSSKHTPRTHFNNHYLVNFCHLSYQTSTSHQMIAIASVITQSQHHSTPPRAYTHTLMIRSQPFKIVLILHGSRAAALTITLYMSHCLACFDNALCITLHRYCRSYWASCRHINLRNQRCGRARVQGN